MRAREFVMEQREGSLEHDVALALPATYIIPKLQNQDPYKQYRFGVAIAGAKGRMRRQEDDIDPYTSQSSWGENQIVVSFDKDVDEYIDDALQQIGLRPSDKKLVSTMHSDEAGDVVETSPLRAFKGYPR